MRILGVLISICLFLLVFNPAMAISDPLAVANNKIGVHILFPSEIGEAANLINPDKKGEWGYVTVPIQAGDRNRDKWQEFLTKCKEFKVIPIIRIATFPEEANWAAPNNYDLIDFANFLNELDWPTQNRYLVIFNEVNRADEFGGQVSPEKYADILFNAINIFKSRSTDFFILPSALDNASINTKISLSWKTFLTRMYKQQPQIFSMIDGWNSHAYPNPDFSSRPDLSGSNKINSFTYDLQFLKKFTDKKLPVFITEAGWSDKYLSDHQIALYYKYAFEKVWSDKNVVAVTPFVLNAQDGPFKKFSLLNSERNAKEFGQTMADYASLGTPAFATPSSQPELLIAQASSSEEISPAVMGSQTDAPTLLNKLYNNLSQIVLFLK